MEKNTVKASFLGLMIALTKDNSFKTIFMATDVISGKTEESTKANGLITKCMEKVLSLGLMEENIREIIFRIVNKALGYLLSKMEEFTKANGWIANNMGVGFSRKRILKRKDYGKMDKE